MKNQKFCNRFAIFKQIMAVAIKMPKMSDTMTEGVVRKWNFKLGDTIKSGDILAEVETDKATMDLENFEKGTILHFAAQEGEAIPIDAVIAVVGKSGEDFSSLLNGSSVEKTKVSETKPTETSQNKTLEVSIVSEINNNSDERIKASPLAKKLAQEKGINLTQLKGSGENGRIIKEDIENYNSSTNTTSVYISGQESFDEIPVSQMRKTIAARLAESKFTAPHFYLTMDINMDNALKARKAINENTELKISVNDMIVKASSIALGKHPWVNASWLGTKIRLNHHVHIGVAMAVEDGLLVPVVKFANQKSLSTISSEIKDFGNKAKDKKLQPSDWSGNTFTISNLGMFGIEEFTAIINPPDACILAVGGVKETVGIVNGEIAKTNVMRVTLSCDHRVVDGVVGSKFLNSLKELLEEPYKMLV